jgi:hypothetical protein
VSYIIQKNVLKLLLNALDEINYRLQTKF